MNELRRFFFHKLPLALGLVASGGLVHFQVSAQAVADPAFERFRSQVVGNSVNYSYGGNGTPLAGAGNATGIGVTAGVDVGRPTRVATKHGPITGTLTQKVSSGAMARGVGRVVGAGALGGPAGLLFLASPFIIDWFTAAGLELDDDGTPTVEAVTDDGCNAWPGPYPNFTACGGGTPTPALPVVVRDGGLCQLRDYCTGDGLDPSFPYYDITLGVAGPEVVDNVPADQAAVEAALESVTNPSPQALAELYKLGETLNYANPIPDLVDTLRAEFEARSPESTSTETTDTPTESKTEETTCATYTQVVANVLSLVEQCETTTTTQAKDPVTGAPVGDPVVTTKTKTDATPDTQTKPEEEPEGLCKLFPNILACVELGTATETIPTTTQSVSYTPESPFGSGTCPADKTFVAFGQTLQLTNMAQACEMLDTYVAPIAVLLAAFTALMIVAVGIPE